MKKNLLERARNHDLNVEDIIEMSSSRDSEVAVALQQIKSQLKWKNKAIELENGGIIPPMGNWVDVACEFIHEGYDGLVELTKNERQVSFVVAFLQSYKTTESVNSLLQISSLFSDNSKAHKESLLKIVSGLNLLLSFKGAPKIDQKLSDQARGLIHQTLILCNSPSEYATAICALRAVGDEVSLELVSNIPKLEGSWVGTENIVKKAIKKRLKSV